MYKFTIKRSTTTEEAMVDIFPEIRAKAMAILKFKSLQPGWVSANHFLTDDHQFHVLEQFWESEEHYLAAREAELADPEIFAAITLLKQHEADTKVLKEMSGETI